MTEESEKAVTEMTQPVIIDLGKQRSQALKDLKKGEGKLWDEVFEVVDEAKEMLGTDAEGKILVPIIILYKEKMNRRRVDLERILFPLMEEYDDDDDEDDEEEEDDEV
jgi:hypothetical protein